MNPTAGTVRHNRYALIKPLDPGPALDRADLTAAISALALQARTQTMPALVAMATSSPEQLDRRSRLRSAWFLGAVATEALGIPERVPLPGDRSVQTPGVMAINTPSSRHHSATPSSRATTVIKSPAVTPHKPGRLNMASSKLRGHDHKRDGKP